jgi:peptidoglycan/LPS O-acetylase OafA/YrhL
MFSWGGQDLDHDHMNSPRLERWKFIALVCGWTLAMGAAMIWLAKAAVPVALLWLALTFLLGMFAGACVVIGVLYPEPRAR